MYYIYMLRCTDNSIYTGIAKDLDRRINEHLTKDEKCAKYTKNHDAQKLECAWSTETKALASKLEFHIKRLSKSQKEDLIKNNTNSPCVEDRPREIHKSFLRVHFFSKYEYLYDILIM